MDENNLTALYERLPIPLQNAVCWAYGARQARFRRGPEFHRHLERLHESEWWSSSDIEAFQDQSVADVVAKAYENVEYHREAMARLGIKPVDVRSRADLAKLPVLTKEDVRHNEQRLISSTADRKRLIARHTSGTTGKSLHFWCTPSSIALQWAVWWRHRSRFGLDVDDWHVNFTGRLVVPPGQERPPFWRWNRPMRQALVNMHHLTPDKAPALAEFLDQRAFVFFSGYPSVIHAFVMSMQDLGLTLSHPPRVVVTGAENALDRQVHDIRNLTGAVVTDQYGLTEGCGNASQCEQMVYHEDFEFGVVECVNPEPQVDGTTRGRILCTSFANLDFGFIRYDTGDVGTWAPPGFHCACGRRSRVILRIEGRIDDYVLTPEGRRIMRFDYVFKDTLNIREAQVVQDEPGAITVRVVRRPGYSAADEREVADQVARWISPQLRVTFEYVDEMEKDANGKFRAVQSLLRTPPAAG